MKEKPGATKSGILIGMVIAAAIVVAVVAVVRFDVTGRKGSGLSRQYSYDVRSLMRTDPNLSVYQELPQRTATHFNEARGVAVGPQGLVYVAGDKAVRIFADNGNLHNELKLSDEPYCLTVTDEGTIYVAMRNHVEVFDAQGERLTIWDSLDPNAVITSIAIYKDDVFVADAGNRVVLHYDTNGRLQGRIGEKNPNRNIPGFVIPSPYFDLAVASDGLLRVTSPGRHRIEAYTFDGDLEFFWGEFSATIEGFCGCCNPVNFAMFEDGSYVTCEKGLVRVKIHDADGRFVGVVAGPEQLLEDPGSRIGMSAFDPETVSFDVAVDNKERVFVLDTKLNVVRVFEKAEPEK